MSDTQKLGSYHTLNEDEFEMEEFTQPSSPLEREIRETARACYRLGFALTKIADGLATEAARESA